MQWDQEDEADEEEMHTPPVSSAFFTESYTPQTFREEARTALEALGIDCQKPVKTFLNRLFSIELGLMRKIFDHFCE